MREEIPELFNLEFNKGIWEQGHVCPKAIDEQILLVTLNKRNHGKEHRYHDYFIDSNTFHWQSQNRSSPPIPLVRKSSITKLKEAMSIFS